MSKENLLWILAILLLLTLLSWVVSNFFPQSLQYLGVILLVIAFIKVRLIIMYFMEAGIVYWPIRFALEVWVVVVGGINVFFYLY